MPAKVGNVVYPPYGFATYLSVRPKTGGSGTPAGLIGVLVVVGIVVVAAVGGGLYVLVKRRSQTADMPVEE